MLEKMTNNWAWKLLSVLLGFVLWLTVVNYDDPFTTKEFRDIPVEKRFSEAITSKEMAITYLEGEFVDVVVRGNRSRVDRLSAKDVVAYVNMNRLSITNTMDIEVSVSENIEVVQRTPSNMQISLEKIDKALKDLQVFYEGELPENFIRLNPVVTPNQLELTGPESRLAMVSSVVVNVKLDEVTDDISVFASPRVLDAQGNEITDLDINNNQIKIAVPVEKIKTIPLRYSTVGEISSDYRLMSLELAIDEITVRGVEEAIDELSRVLVTNIDLSTLTDETSTIEVTIDDYLPEGIELFSTQALTSMEVDVEKIVRQDYNVTSADITVKSLDEKMQFKFVEELNIPIIIKGIEKDLDDLSVEDFRPSINLKNLEPGEHQVPVSISISSKFELANTIQQVLVELSEVPEVLPEEEVDETGGTEAGDVTSTEGSGDTGEVDSNEDHITTTSNGSSVDSE